MNQVIEQPISEQVQIQKVLEKIIEKKDKLAGAKEILKSYKIKSDKLTQLKRVQKDLKEQIIEEKKRIEDEYLDDRDYEDALNESLTLKNDIKELAGELRQLSAKKYNPPTLKTEDHNLVTGQYKLQLEFVPRVYINGSELK